MIREIFLLQNPWRENLAYKFNLKEREILSTLLQNMENELILGLIGSRQVGKSSLLYLLIEHLLSRKTAPEDIFYFNLDDLKLHELFSSLPDFIQFVGKDGNKKYILIDEIQRLSSPGLFLKEIFDLKHNFKIIYTGSSQLEIKAKVKEHLVGRARVFGINRLSFREYINFSRPVTNKEALTHALIYGTYPAVAKETMAIDKKLRINDIFQSYVRKDLVDFLKIEKTEEFNKLLILLAYQAGNLLNISTLSNSLGIPRQDVKKYINILESTFICKRIYPFHKNYKKEIIKTPKLYFLDTGLRNFILDNFNNPDIRNDTGTLFENFVLAELLANDHYMLKRINYWRTTNQTEIDFIVRSENQTEAIEVKWKGRTIPKAFKTLTTFYPDIKTRLVTSEDFTGLY